MLTSLTASCATRSDLRTHPPRHRLQQHNSVASMNSSEERQELASKTVALCACIRAIERRAIPQAVALKRSFIRRLEDFRHEIAHLELKSAELVDEVCLPAVDSSELLQRGWEELADKKNQKLRSLLPSVNIAVAAEAWALNGYIREKQKLRDKLRRYYENRLPRRLERLWLQGRHEQARMGLAAANALFAWFKMAEEAKANGDPEALKHRDALMRMAAEAACHYQFERG